MESPLADLEQTLIDDYLRARGCPRAELETLPDADRHQLLKDASVYASSKLGEIESRSRFIHDLQDHAANVR